MNYLTKPVLFDTDKHYCDTTGFSSGSVLNCGTRVQGASIYLIGFSWERPRERQPRVPVHGNTEKHRFIQNYTS